MNGESGTMFSGKAKLYDVQSQDDAILILYGIKLADSRSMMSSPSDPPSLKLRRTRDRAGIACTRNRTHE